MKPRLILAAPYGKTEETILVAEAWREAATDLHIEVSAPFTLRTDDGETLEFIALVHTFGKPAGTLVAGTAETLTSLAAVAEASGYFVSLLNLAEYSRYDKQLFIDTLNDWRYFGEDPAPGWYTGERWS